MRAPVVPTFTPPPRERSYTGITVSTVLHALLLYLILSPYFRHYHILDPNGSGPGMGGGGGSGGAQYIALPALRQFATPPAPKVETPVVPPVTPPPTVVPTVIPPPTPQPDTQPTPPASGQAPGSANGAGGAGQGGSGGGTGGGNGPGSGAGTGPGTGGGERGEPPQIRGFPVPPTEGTPKALRGRELPIRCYVGLDGKVERFEFGIEVADAGFRRKLEDVIAGFKFRPARDSTGAVVRGVTTVTITLANH